MFLMQVCCPNEDKEKVKQEEAFEVKYSLVVIHVFVLVQDACFSIDVSGFP